jgi:hypothetical protein
MAGREVPNGMVIRMEGGGGKEKKRVLDVFIIQRRKVC